MKLVILDPQGLGLDLATLAMSQGHEVVHYIKDTPKSGRIGDKVVGRVRGNLDDALRNADVVFITDNMAMMSTYDAIRKDHPGVWIGPTCEHAKWEHDRELGQDIMQRYGVATAPYKAFSDYNEAIAYVKKRDTRLVSKPFGSDNKALSYVAKGPEDLVFMLNRWKTLGKLKDRFILQDFVPGVEVAVGGWFDGESFVSGFHENFEFKKLMNGDIGPNTGEQGTLLRITETSTLADKVLLPFEAMLKAHNYVGYFDTNVIVDKKGVPYPLEFTVRPGWPTFNLQLSLCKGDIVEDLAAQKAPRFHRGRTCCGVVLTIPDYPYSHITRREVTGIPVWGFDSDNLHHHPCEMMQDREGQWVTAGDYVCVLTGHGATVTEAKTQAYKNLKALTLPNSPMYRTDIGDRLKQQLPLLQSHSLAESWRY